MRKFSTLFLIISLSATLFASPIHSKLNHSIIIETDCSSSDLKAISMLVWHPAITVKAIVISDYCQGSGKDIINIKKLLSVLGADTLPVLDSAGEGYPGNLEKILQSEKEKISIIALGSGSISSLIRENKIISEVTGDFIWFGHGSQEKIADAIRDRFFIAESGIHFDIITNLEPETEINDEYIASIYKRKDARLAEAFRSIPRKDKHPEGSEIAAIYLINPELFSMSLFENKKKVNISTGYNLQSLREVLADMLEEKYKSGHFVALYGFPLIRELYTYDIRMIMDSAISQYGAEEWKACVLTDEFHGHLGVYSIVGAKMGIRAREYFNVGTDLLEIHSYAGSEEPFSCMNDGLQVSTGATLGQGSIHLVPDTVAKSQAIFTYNDKSILISLKPEYKSLLRSVIDEGIRNYGLEDEGYWNLVRQTAIKFWLEWDRNRIFDITELSE